MSCGNCNQSQYLVGDNTMFDEDAYIGEGNSNHWDSDPTFEELDVAVIQWAEEKGILDLSDPKSQLLKTVSEVGELADAINKGDEDEITDALGDTVVTLIILAELTGRDLTTCLESAYNVIKGRSGKMINNVFVKDETNE